MKTTCKQALDRGLRNAKADEIGSATIFDAGVRSEDRSGSIAAGVHDTLCLPCSSPPFHLLDHLTSPSVKLLD
jgi:hypothetical protein